MTTTPDIRSQYDAAVEQLVADLERDRQVLALVLFGSLAYDVVWHRSDIDLMIVVSEQARDEPSAGMLSYNGINVHAQLTTRDEFKRFAGGARVGSGLRSMFETSRLLFSRDRGISALYDEATSPGRRDRTGLLLQEACAVVPTLIKAEKWFTVKGDSNYAAVWLLFAVQGIARIEVVRQGGTVTREALLQAADLAPDTFAPLYPALVANRLSKRTVGAALAQVNTYLRTHVDVLFSPIIDYLDDADGARTAAEIEHHFDRYYDVTGVVSACEWLAEQGHLLTMSLPVRLTRKSRVDVEGLAFIRAPKQ